jgi:hypothetical protein
MPATFISWGGECELEGGRESCGGRVVSLGGQEIREKAKRGKK